MFSWFIAARNSKSSMVLFIVKMANENFVDSASPATTFFGAIHDRLRMEVQKDINAQILYEHQFVRRIATV